MDSLACRVGHGGEGQSLSNHLFPSPSKGLSSIAQALGERGRQGQTAPGCAVEAQTQGRRQDGGEGAVGEEEGISGRRRGRNNREGQRRWRERGLAAPSPILP